MLFERNSEKPKTKQYVSFIRMNSKRELDIIVVINSPEVLFKVKRIKELIFLSLYMKKDLRMTWNKMKWIRWRSNLGQPNQKKWSLGLTSTVPLTTWDFSWLSKHILVIMPCNFVPTSNSICKTQNTFTTLILWQEYFHGSNVIYYTADVHIWQCLSGIESTSNSFLFVKKNKKFKDRWTLPHQSSRIKVE